MRLDPVELGELGGELVQALLAPAGQDQILAIFGEYPRRGLADARGRAGDQDHGLLIP